MLKQLLLIVLFIPILCKSQLVQKSNQQLDNRGIQWTEGSSWQKILDKAKAERKYIFVDCFATWCRPCKIMDREVYSNDTIGNYMNEHFISIKIQIDTTDHDNDSVKNWYKIAAYFQKEFSVKAMPSLLFFSPEGNIVHKDIGVKSVQQMMKLATYSMDSTKQYYRLLEKYKKGSIELTQLPYLAFTANLLEDSALALKVADEYTDRYIDILPTDSLFNKEIISFIGTFPENIHLKDKMVILCYRFPARIDSCMFNGFAKSVIDFVINKNFTRPFFEKLMIDINATPNWKKLNNEIKKHFGVKYATATVLDLKPNFYRSKQDWKSYTKAIIQKVGKNYRNKFQGLEDAYDLNNYAWEIFLHSYNGKELHVALAWSDYALSMATGDSLATAGCLDTKANLLYKMQRRKEAITIEESVQNWAPQEKMFEVTLSKMRNGEPTWQ